MGVVKRSVRSLRPGSSGTGPLVQTLASATLALGPPLSLMAQTRQCPLLFPTVMLGVEGDGFMVLTVFIVGGARC